MSSPSDLVSLVWFGLLAWLGLLSISWLPSLLSLASPWLPLATLGLVYKTSERGGVLQTSPGLLASVKHCRPLWFSMTAAFGCCFFCRVDVLQCHSDEESRSTLGADIVEFLIRRKIDIMLGQSLLNS